jgi:glycine/D-amino acid oxidase-like deaminating enzyme
MSVMDLLSDQPFWLVRDGLLHVYPPLENDERTDVAIVGAGITGALIADRLANAGIDCLVVDRRDVCCGSTAGNTALIQYELDTSLVDLANKLPLADAQRVYQLNVEAVRRIASVATSLDGDIGYGDKTSLFLARTERDAAGLPQECDLRRRAGIAVEHLGRDELIERFQLDLPGALVSDVAGSCDPYRLAHLLLQSAQRKGARIFDRTSVTRFGTQRSPMRLETSRGSSILAKYCVIATGYEATQLLGRRWVKLRNTYAAISAPLTDRRGWDQRWIAWDSSQPYLYFRATADNRLLFGGEDDSFHNPARRDARINKKISILGRKLRRLLPALEFEIEFGWAGTFGETEDGLGYIGQCGALPNTFFALGFGGNGITMSSIAADFIADALLGCPSDDQRLFQFDRHR